jgi:tetratricopeptide (TPR) repeat protein
VDWIRTIRKLERALSRDPRSRLFLPLAEAHRELGHHQRAVELFQAGLKHHPGYIRARIGLARTLKILGRFDESREQLHRVVSLAPDNGLARRLLAELYQSEGLPEQAALEVRAWLRYQPEAAGMVARLEGTALRSARFSSRAAISRILREENCEPVHAGPIDGDAERITETVGPGDVDSLKEGVEVNRPTSKPLLNPGVGVAASRRAELEAQTILDSATDNPFEDLLGLSGLAAKSRNPTLQAIYREFFPGAFDEPELVVEPAPSQDVALEVALVASPTPDVEVEPLLDSPLSVPVESAKPIPPSVIDELFDSREDLGLDLVADVIVPETTDEVGLGAPPIQTLSLVELYLQQGFVDEAREMLERLAEANPDDPRIRQRLSSLRSSTGDSASPHDVLKRWLSAIERVKRHRGFALLS